MPLAGVADGNQSLGTLSRPGGQVGGGQQGDKRRVGKGANKRPRAGESGLRVESVELAAGADGTANLTVGLTWEGETLSVQVDVRQ